MGGGSILSGGVYFFVSQHRAQSARGRPKADLGVGTGGGRPLMIRGFGGVTPGKFLNSISDLVQFYDRKYQKMYISQISQVLLKIYEI